MQSALPAVLLLLLLTICGPNAVAPSGSGGSDGRHEWCVRQALLAVLFALQLAVSLNVSITPVVFLCLHPRSYRQPHRGAQTEGVVRANDPSIWQLSVAH